MKRRVFLAGGLAAGAAVLGAGSAVFSVARDPAGWDEAYDVVVAGGGAAGLAAAASAAAEGASVLLLEKEGALGGDTLISGGYFNAVCTDCGGVHDAGRVRDSVARFRDQILASGGSLASPALAQALAAGSGPALSWLKAIGVRFLPQPREIYGGMFPRAFKSVLSRGEGYIRALHAECERRKVVIRTGSPVRSLVFREGGSVLGVAAVSDGMPLRIRSKKGVVIASGGYGASPERLLAWAPRFAELPHDSQEGATGELIEAAGRAGAAVVNLDQVECTPGNGAVRGVDQARLDIVPGRMIMVDSSGRRFVDETGYRSLIAEAILKLPSRACWSVADADTVSSFEFASQKRLLKGYYAGGVFREATPAALARRIGVPERAFCESVRAMRDARGLKTSPFWAAPVSLRIHATLGGLRIDERARCLDAEGNPLAGLWAAGAVIGNIHGANRLGGNGINTAVVFGRLAGRGAARGPELV